MKDNKDMLIDEIDGMEEKTTSKTEAERAARMDDLIEKALRYLDGAEVPAELKDKYGI